MLAGYRSASSYLGAARRLHVLPGWPLDGGFRAWIRRAARALDRDTGPATRAVVIEVTDTGVGITEEAIPRIFRPYVSTTEGGTGLGLPTTLRFVRLHGGTILVESEPEQGSRFSIILPAEESES